MIKALITDVSKVILFTRDEKYTGSLNALYKERLKSPNFNFFDTFLVNTELLNFYKSLSIEVDILTSDIIQDAPELKPYWENVITNIFSATKMGTHKSRPEAYTLVLEKLYLKPDEVIYVDDNEENIKAANTVGLQAILYKKVDKAIEEIVDRLKA